MQRQFCTECSLADAQKKTKELENKIKQLEEPLNIDLESVELSDEDMVLTPRDARAPGKKCQISAPEIMRSCAVKHAEELCFVPNLIEDDSPPNLRYVEVVAEQDLRQTPTTELSWRGVVEQDGASRQFGHVPAVSTLPDDNSVAAILACNRFRSAVSHIESIHQAPPELQQAASAAQHYMSGRQWIMSVRPQAGTAWSMPGVQEIILQHRYEFDSLSTALEDVQDGQQEYATSSARKMANQLWSPPPQNPEPVHPAVSDHLQNFQCSIPPQLSQLHRWRSMFVDAGGLVEDPVSLLQVRIHPTYFEAHAKC